MAMVPLWSVKVVDAMRRGGLRSDHRGARSRVSVVKL